MNFDAKKQTEHIVEWIKDWFDNNGPKAKAIVGISGGKDSSVVAALLVKALGKERVIGVLMPNGEQPDIDDSKKLVSFLGLQHYIVNINDTVNALEKVVSNALNSSLSTDTTINIQPRVRMSVLYAIAQSTQPSAMVANTCNRSEDYIGYSTKYGDAAGDFSPLADYTVTEVLKIGDELGLPTELVHKTPSDGLSGKSDEDKIGFTYAVLDKYILEGVCEDAPLKEKIDRMHRRNLHKITPMPVCKKL